MTLFVLELLLLAVVILYLGYLTWLMLSEKYGSAYVPTRAGEIDAILKKVRLKKGARWLEVGCGDGRVSMRAYTLYNVKAKGIDINPYLIAKAKLMAFFYKIPVQFAIKDAFAEDYGAYEVLYIFLLPTFIVRLEPYLARCKKGTLVISHGFMVPYLADKLLTVKHATPYNTYYYRI